MADLLNSNDIFYTNFETKVQNRFLMLMDGVPGYVIRKTDRPKFSSEKKSIDFINVQRYYKGKSTWQDISLSLYDPIVPSSAQSIMEWIRLSHESITGRDGYAEFYQKDISIQVIGPPGDIVELWNIYGAWVQSADFGTLDWQNTGDPVDINLVVSYNYAVLQF